MYCVLQVSQKMAGRLGVAVVLTVSAVVALALATGCASPEPRVVVNTVEVDRVVTVEVPVPQTVVVREDVIVVETVEVERVVEVPVVQTVVVEVPVLQTVEVDRVVEVPVVQTVAVEVPVLQTVEVERVVEVPVVQTVAVEVPVLQTVEVERVVEVPVIQTVVVERVEVVIQEVTKVIEEISIPTPSPPKVVIARMWVGLPEVPRNRTLVVTHWSDSYREQHDHVENFNWWLPGNSHARHVGAKGLIEYLFYANLNTGEITPWLGESFIYHDSLDAIDVKVREGAKWSDGIPFTAHDIKFTIDMVIENAPHLKRSQMWASMISSVDVHDDHTLTINLTTPDPRFFQSEFVAGFENHSPFVPKHVWEGKDPLTFTNFDTSRRWPLGTGAYRLSYSWVDEQYYDRRDNWWASEVGFHDLPQIERIIYVAVANPEIGEQMYIDNDLDAGPPMHKDTFEVAKAFNPALRSWNFEGPVWGAPDGCNYVLVLNNQKDHFSDVNVRWAINHAIDREEIIATAYWGGVPPVVVPISSYGVKQYLPHVQDIIDKYNPDDPDPTKVESRMTASGYSKDSEGFWNKDGERVQIVLEIPSWMRPQGPVP